MAKSSLFKFFNDVMKVIPTTKSNNLAKEFDTKILNEIKREVIRLDIEFKRNIMKILTKWAKQKGINLSNYSKDDIYSALKKFTKQKMIKGLFIGLI